MKTHLYASGKKTLQVLNDLIRINIDRITGFEKAAHEEATPDRPLRDEFYRMAIEGRSNVNDLHARVIRLGGAPVTNGTVTGKIYLCWLETHPQFQGACTAAGEATEAAYRHALEEQLPQELHELVENQLWALERANRRLAALATHA